MKIDLLSAEVCRSIRSAPTLKTALETFISTVAHDSTTSVYSIIRSGLNVRVCRRHKSPPTFDTKIYTDLDFFIDLTFIVREFGGRKWFPKYIAFQFWPPARGAPMVYFPRTRFLFDQGQSWIELPRSFLKLSRRSHHLSNTHSITHVRLRHLVTDDAAAFIFALKRVLREHASEGYPDIDSAAEVMCTSVRTLQRALAKAGVTYSKVVEHARFEVAEEMLTNPKLKVIDIAYALGYEDPSHFSRAFRRTTGQSPREFRASRLHHKRYAQAVRNKTADK